MADSHILQQGSEDPLNPNFSILGQGSQSIVISAEAMGATINQQLDRDNVRDTERLAPYLDANGQVRFDLKATEMAHAQGLRRQIQSRNNAKIYEDMKNAERASQAAKEESFEIANAELTQEMQQQMKLLGHLNTAHKRAGGAGDFRTLAEALADRQIAADFFNSLEGQ